MKLLQLCNLTSQYQTAIAVSAEQRRYIGLTCPSKAVDEKLEIQVAQEALGFKVKPGKHLTSRRGHLAGTDSERTSDINNMFADKDIKAIICLSGGSGAARIFLNQLV